MSNELILGLVNFLVLGVMMWVFLSGRWTATQDSRALAMVERLTRVDRDMLTLTDLLRRECEDQEQRRHALRNELAKELGEIRLCMVTRDALTEARRTSEAEHAALRQWCQELARQVERIQNGKWGKGSVT